jgi:ketopantoate reductase
MESIIAGMGLNGNHIKQGTRAGVRCPINDLTLSSITQRERERERESE